MLQKTLVTSLILAMAVSAAMAADTTQAKSQLSAAEIVSKNVAARGGLKAWRDVQTMSESGKLGAGGNRRDTLPTPAALPNDKRVGLQQLPSSPRLAQEAQLPFVLEMERPRKTRFEIKFNGQTAVQVYDGTNGWKVRPFLNRHDVEPYTADEVKIASTQTEIDGPLVDYAAKGTRVELAGMEKIGDQDTYKLMLTFKSGKSIHVWIDAKTFLEAKVEGQPRRLDGKMHPVEIYYHDYRQVSGLQIPFELETKVLPVDNPATKIKERPVAPEKIVIDKVEVNPKLDASHFSKPTTDVAVVTH
jgi:hypothetical protein